MILQILFTLFLVLLNGFFVAAEFAIVKVRSSQIELLAKTGSRPAAMAKKILGRLDAYLSATQLGITLASLGLGWIGESVVSQIIINTFGALDIALNPETAHRIALPVSFAVITVLHIVFGELAPKSLAIQRSEATTLAIAFPLQLFYVLFKPAIWVLNGLANMVIRAFGIEPANEQELHSPEEIRYLVDQSGESGGIESTNYEIIRNAFDFSERSVRQIMVPRVRITALNIEQADEDVVLDKIIDEGFSRVPVYRNSVDNIIGIIYVKDLLLMMRRQKGEVSVKDLMRPAHFVPESKKIIDLLHDFQQQRTHMAVVVNEYGGTEGIVSMEDIVEEIVGEIQDEYDNETPIVEEIDKQNFKVLGGASIADVNEYLPEPIPESKEYESLAGLLIYHLGRIPNAAEKITIGDYEFTVLTKIRNNIGQVQVSKM